MTKKEFRGLWAVPLDMDARRKRIEQMQAMLDDAPVVVDTVQASSAAPAYGMHTVKIAGIETSGRAERRTVLAKLQDDMERRNRQYKADYAQAVEMIEAIEDADLRTAVHMVCLEGEGWEYLAARLGKTGDAWRMRVERWLDANLQ